MRKEDLVCNIAAETGLSMRAAEEMLDAFVRTVSWALHSGEHVAINGFGTFEVKHRAARVGRTKVNGVSTPVPIKARDVPVFTPTKTFRDSF